ncbi:MAG: DUF3800 domain-containing protein [Patescibacteria group bacterium]
MKYLFIDESGDHNLLPSKIDPQFPMFVLTGIVFESKEYQKFKIKILNFKKEIFSKKRIILHSKELTRPNKAKQKELGLLTDSASRLIFYTRLNEILEKTNFEILVYSIDKGKFHDMFKDIPVDLYFLSFTKILNSFKSRLNHTENVKIIAEARNKKLDKQFSLTCENIKILDSHKHLSLKIQSKSWQYSGLELADLISYRVSRKLSDKPAKPVGNEVDIGVIIKKNVYNEQFDTKEKGKRIRTSP